MMAREINVRKYYRCIFNIVVFIASFIKVNQLEIVNEKTPPGIEVRYSGRVDLNPFHSQGN